MKVEIWQNIKGFNDQASDLGRIKILARTIYRQNNSQMLGYPVKVTFKEKIIEASDKRLNIGLYNNDGVRINQQIAYFILLAFKERPEGNTIVASHLDENPTNNKLSNLVWETQANNTQRIARGRGKLNKEKVLEIRQMLASGMKQCVISDILNIPRPTITGIKNNRTWANIQL